MYQKLPLVKNMENEYITPQDVTKVYGVTSTTLRNWAESGKIRCIRPLGGRRLYDKRDVERVFCQEGTTPKERSTIIYARVGSESQRDDLDKQITHLRNHHPLGKVITDISTGLNWDRKGMMTLLEGIADGSVGRVVTTHRDTICRFGFEIFEWICNKFKTEIIIIGHATDADRAKDLAEDLFSVVTVFVAKNNGIRAARRRARADSESNN
jgi:putative resolvase